MCLAMLRGDSWKPPNRIAAVLAAVAAVLVEPKADDAVETAIADVYRRDRAAFARTARDWVKQYAT